MCVWGEIVEYLEWWSEEVSQDVEARYQEIENREMIWKAEHQFKSNIWLVGADWGHKIPGLETKEFITHCQKATQASPYLPYLSLVLKSHWNHATGPDEYNTRQGSESQLWNMEFGAFIAKYKSAFSFFWGTTLSHPSKLAAASTNLRNDKGKGIVKALWSWYT